MKYSLAKGQQGEDNLLINGKQSVCPFTAPIPFTGNMGQIQIMRMPCSTLCPHAKVTQGISGDTYSITCGNEFKTFELERDENGGEPKPTSKLVSL